MLSCFCGLTYHNATDLEEHRRARGHFSAHICGPLCKHLKTPAQVFQVVYCPSCEKKCERHDILEDHRRFTGHCYCSECEKPFANQAALVEHMASFLHATEFRCCDCNFDFKDIAALEAHLSGKRHKKRLNPDPKNSSSKKMAKKAAVGDVKSHCKICKRTFKSQDALKQHQTSLRHKPLSNISCPAGKECTKQFPSPSALLHHLESGACDSGITRTTIRELALSHDSDHVITRAVAIESCKTPLFQSADSLPESGAPPTWLSSSVHNSWVAIRSALDATDLNSTSTDWSLINDSFAVTPNSSYASLPNDDCSLSNIVSEEILRCPLCPARRKHFATPQALRSHLSSAAHSPKIFYCPLSLAPPDTQRKTSTAVRHFSTLSGLAQHLECGACQGGNDTFTKVFKLVEMRLKQYGFSGLLISA